jgi:hypothetical protein
MDPGSVATQESGIENRAPTKGGRAWIWCPPLIAGTLLETAPTSAAALSSEVKEGFDQLTAWNRGTLTAPTGDAFSNLSLRGVNNWCDAARLCQVHKTTRRLSLPPVLKE